MELQSVIKRDGSTVPYNREKIITAINKANNEVEPEEKVTDEQIENIVRLIEKRKCKRMLVEDIQDIIETELMALDGSIIPADGLIEVATPDEDGFICFAADMPYNAECYIKELETDEHYILSDEQYLSGDTAENKIIFFLVKPIGLFQTFCPYVLIKISHTVLSLFKNYL